MCEQLHSNISTFWQNVFYEALKLVAEFSHRSCVISVLSSFLLDTRSLMTFNKGLWNYSVLHPLALSSKCSHVFFLSSIFFYLHTNSCAQTHLCNSLISLLHFLVKSDAKGSSHLVPYTPTFLVAGMNTHKHSHTHSHTWHLGAVYWGLGTYYFFPWERQFTLLPLTQAGPYLCESKMHACTLRFLCVLLVYYI